MKRIVASWVAGGIIVATPLVGLAGGVPSPAALMPREADYTHMGWAEEFPLHTPNAPWQRVIRTGHYAMALDTETLSIPHFGAVQNPGSYAEDVQSRAQLWRSLPRAELQLRITAEGRDYHATAGGPWTRFTGPRLIESGRFVQRSDVTDLVFAAEDGTRLNVEARFETVAWPDRLGLILAARPGWPPIPAGESCFGRVGGGFGLTGTNHLEVAPHPELDAETFTLELWVYVPADCEKATRAFPWLVCKNAHEEAEGHFGIVVVEGRPQGRINLGGGRRNGYRIDGRSPLTVEAWNHLAISYDGELFRLYHNGRLSAERNLGRRRAPTLGGLAVGRRLDNAGDGYHFRGVVDEIRFYAQALEAEAIQARFLHPETVDPACSPTREWTFRADGRAFEHRPGTAWDHTGMAISFNTPESRFSRQSNPPADDPWRTGEWREVSLAFHPVPVGTHAPVSTVGVQAMDDSSGAARPVDYDAARGWHRINLDGIAPILPNDKTRDRRNDAMERVRLVLSNPADEEQTARLLFEKTAGGFRQDLGSPITGLSAILRYPDGQPTGIPVQLSKNWHGRRDGGVYAGLWFHGFSQLHLPPRSKVELVLAIVYGHWGGVAAASHAQLCLIGWGSNQLWNESALGSWGESLCYEPDQVQGRCSILDVRPLMVRSMATDQPWQWTHNVGGGDFFRVFDSRGRRLPHAGMSAAYERYGPCLTEVTYAGRIGPALTHRETVSLARTDDLVRGVYRIRLDVSQPMTFSRLVFFQIGADTYSYTGERRMALGNETGLLREWLTQWGGDTDRTPPMECTGRVPWVSLHEAVSRAEHEARARGEPGAPGAWANRGVVIRSWEARLGGKPASPWVLERGVHTQAADTSTLDVVPPPGVKRLEPGDFVEATLEHIVMPQFADDYYGPNEALRTALKAHQNTWRMIQREAVGNERRVSVKTGTLEALYPAVSVVTAGDIAEFTLTGGLGYLPLTFSGLTSPRDQVLWVDGRPLDQAVHGNDFWQTDYDPLSRRWSRTYTIPITAERPHSIRFASSQ